MASKLPAARFYMNQSVWCRNYKQMRMSPLLPPFRQVRVLPVDPVSVLLVAPQRRSFGTSTKGGSNLPSNETAKSLSNRDKNFYAQVKKLKSSIDQDPPVISQGFYPTAITSNGVYMGSTYLEHPPQTLTHLFASAILDPKTYCKLSASSTSTISGSDAARRLLRGKRNFRETMRKELTLRPKDVLKIYVLEGHGVPVQLWEHLLQEARAWLQSEDSAHELSVQNVFGALNFDK